VSLIICVTQIISFKNLDLFCQNYVAFDKTAVVLNVMCIFSWSYLLTPWCRVLLEKL